MIGAAIRKEVALLVRDRGALLSLFVLPVLLMAALGATLKPGTDGQRPARVALSHGADARGQAVERMLLDARGVHVIHADTPAHAEHIIADEDASAAIVVPTTGPIELVIDGALPLQARSPLEGALTAVVMQATATGAFELPVVRTPSGAGDPLTRISSFQLSVPSNAVLFGFFIALTVALAFATERRTGTWRRLLAAPVPRWKLLVAMLVPYFLIGLVQLAFLFAVGRLAFGMHVAGSPSALVAVSVAVTFCAVALGLVFAAVARNERQLGGVGSVVLLVMGMLGGAMIPRIVMPPIMQSVGLAVPHGWAIDAYYAVLVRPSTTIADILPALGAIGAFGAAFLVVGILLFRFEA